MIAFEEVQKHHFRSDEPRVSTFQFLFDNRILSKEDLVKKGDYTFPGCACLGVPRVLNNLRRNQSFKESTCSDLATQRGLDQKVISYSYYSPDRLTNTSGLHFKKYLGTMQDQLKFIQNHMPGWVVRIYHNVSVEDSAANEYMCNLTCLFYNVDFCNVNNLPTLGNLYKKQPIGRLWRFAVLGDPTVRIFLCRDTDSLMIERERDAVSEWLNNSGYEFHIMRDHPQHVVRLMAGLWGGWNIRKKRLVSIRNRMFSQPANFAKQFDQPLLKSYLWPIIKDSVLEHDSNYCTIFRPSSRPYPTKRKGSTYVGGGPYFNLLEANYTCPVECRPKEHPDWILC